MQPVDSMDATWRVRKGLEYLANRLARMTSRLEADDPLTIVLVRGHLHDMVHEVSKLLPLVAPADRNHALAAEVPGEQASGTPVDTVRQLVRGRPRSEVMHSLPAGFSRLPTDLQKRIVTLPVRPGHAPSMRTVRVLRTLSKATEAVVTGALYRQDVVNCLDEPSLHRLPYLTATCQVIETRPIVEHRFPVRELSHAHARFLAGVLCFGRAWPALRRLELADYSREHGAEDIWLNVPAVPQLTYLDLERCGFGPLGFDRAPNLTKVVLAASDRQPVPDFSPLCRLTYLRFSVAGANNVQKAAAIEAMATVAPTLRVLEWVTGSRVQRDRSQAQAQATEAVTARRALIRKLCALDVDVRVLHE